MLTPCVFPLLPVTVSFFSKQKGPALPRALVYAFGIVFTITVIGLIFKSGLDIVETRGLIVGKDVDYRTSGEEPGRNHLILLLMSLKLVSGDRLFPDAPLGVGNEIERRVWRRSRLGGRSAPEC